MKLPPWAFIFFRKIPHNYHGDIVLRFEHGDLTKFLKLDEVDKRTFLDRHKECQAEVLALEHKQGDILNGA